MQAPGFCRRRNLVEQQEKEEKVKNPTKPENIPSCRLIVIKVTNTETAKLKPNNSRRIAEARQCGDIERHVEIILKNKKDKYIFRLQLFS